MIYRAHKNISADGDSAACCSSASADSGSNTKSNSCGSPWCDTFQNASLPHLQATTVAICRASYLCRLHALYTKDAII